MLRRSFLKSGSLAAAGSLMVPRFLKALAQQPLALQGDKIVVVIQLSGGNDGLNTIIPIENDLYYRARPRLGIGKSTALHLTEQAGIHPQLAYFRELYQQGHLSILHGVGYPHPDKSHFRSMDIWHTASHAHEYLSTGWLGRYLDARCAPCGHATQVLELDDALSLALKGSQYHGIAMQDPARLFATGSQPHLKHMADHPHAHEPMAAYLYKTLTNTLENADYIFKESRRKPSAATYPNTTLGKNLKTIASLSSSRINTRVYYVSHGSFDTHVNQEAQHNRLFTELNDAVKSFVEDLKQQGRFKDVLLFTFSEFGRRVNQNASGGTDHGAANNMLFVSGALQQQGLVNELPDLTKLQGNDLSYTVDFRQVYQMVLEKWLDTPAAPILQGSFAPLHIV